MTPAFGSVAEFFAMSGYGHYVWWSVALALGTVVLNAWLAVRSLSKARGEARRRLEMNP
jgi:heme exporter protein CcmD